MYFESNRIAFFANLLFNNYSALLYCPLSAEFCIFDLSTISSVSKDPFVLPFDKKNRFPKNTKGTQNFF